MLLMTWMLTLLVALQQGAPGAVQQTEPDASGGAANWMFMGLMALFIVLAIVMAVSYLGRRKIG